MNERIKDLWQQAACFVNPLKEGGEWQAEFVEKFTELVVKECAMCITTPNIQALPPNDVIMKTVLDVLVSDMNEHFGVEE